MAFFWEEDDDPFDDQPLTQQSGTQLLSSSQATASFHCPRCGSNDSYELDGLPTCRVCFAVSQTSVTIQDEATWEDVQGLAARNARGVVQQRQINGTRKRTRTALETLDRSTPLPTIDQCLQAVRAVLTNAVERLVYDILPKECPKLFSTKMMDQEETHRNALHKNLLKRVGILWKCYLRAWSDGAQHFGTLHPDVRFCFRDTFLPPNIAKKLIRQHLVQAVLDQQQQQQDDENSDDTGSNSSDDDPSTDDDNDSDREEEGKSGDKLTNSALEDVADESKSAPGTVDKPPRKKRTKTTHLSPAITIKRIVYSHCARQQLGYKEVALLVTPCLKLLPAILYLALNDIAPANFATHDWCRWIESGQLPLTNAFVNMLTTEQQRRLVHVRSWFSLPYNFRPNELDHYVHVMSVICRKRKVPLRNQSNLDACQVDKFRYPWKHCHRHGSVRPWDVDDLPMILAKLVQDCGLDQQVLNRALVLGGFPFAKKMSDTKKSLDESVLNPYRRSKLTSIAGTCRYPLTIDDLPTIVQPRHLTRRDELLALVAIACQLDPDWRTWEFRLPKTPVMVQPVNESQFQLLQDADAMESYLSFLENDNVQGPNDDIINPDEHSKSSLLPSDFFLQAPKNIVKTYIGERRPCPVIAGRPVSDQRDFTNLKCRNDRLKVASSSVGKGKGRETPMSLPRYDFEQGEERLNHWIPKRHGHDTDVDRLVEALAYAVDGDAPSVHFAMQRMLQRKKRL